VFAPSAPSGARSTSRSNSSPSSEKSLPTHCHAIRELEAQRLRQDLTHIGRVSALGELTASLATSWNQPADCGSSARGRSADALLAGRSRRGPTTRPMCVQILAKSLRLELPPACVTMRWQRLLRGGAVLDQLV